MTDLSEICLLLVFQKNEISQDSVLLCPMLLHIGALPLLLHAWKLGLKDRRVIAQVKNL